MAPATRSRQALVLSDSKTKSNNEIARKNTQDANSSPPIKSGRISKNSQSKASTIKSKVHVNKKDPSLAHEKTLLTMKSPVLRDRTNTSNKLNKVLASTKNSVEVNSSDKKKMVKTTELCNTKFVDKKQKVQKENINKQNTKETKVNNKHTIGTRFNKIILEKSDSKVNASGRNSVSCVNVDKGTIKKWLTGKTESPDENSNTNRVLRKKNICIDTVEQILNKDEEMDKSDKHDAHKKSNEFSIGKKIANHTDVEKLQANKPNRKFFKNRIVQEEIKTAPPVKKTKQRKINKFKKDAKRIQSDDSSFSPAFDEKRQSRGSVKSPSYNVRSRGNKNYCELSVISQESNYTENKKVDDEKDLDIDKDLKKIPIYKTMKLSEDNLKDKEEIYDYLDDSQENVDKKSKKKKKIVKKPTIKRSRKAKTSKLTAIPKAQKKTIKKASYNVQLKEQNKTSKNIKKVQINSRVVVESMAGKNVHMDTHNLEFSKQIIPEHLMHAGDSTIAEASTIKLLPDKKLTGNQKYSLTSTPAVPRTITSELKIFGPQHITADRPVAKNNKMVDHSLIRKSMSPITKVDENFDTGSPWRAIDAFSRVNQIVQSTPQINRLPLLREKKLPTHLSELNKKSLNSEDTIHISSFADKSLEKQKTLTIPSTNTTEVSPRKFGTIISNLSPVKSINNCQSPIQNKLQSSVQTTLSSVAPSEISIGEEGSMIPTIYNKENILTNPIKSPRKKISTPSPFRFEKIKSSKRLATRESVSKIPQFNAQEISDEVDPKVGPSYLEKAKSNALKQSNLNYFLNLDEVPESTKISTGQGLFDDIHSTPIAGKKIKCRVEEPNIHNAFGFDDSDVIEIISDKSSGSIIATEQDIKDNNKGKLFPKARVKSFMPSRISENIVKKTLLKNVLIKKTSQKKEPEIVHESDESVSIKENNEFQSVAVNNNEYKKSAKEVAFDAVSFSDTFDVLSENGEIESKLPEEIPLFVDLEPVHFTKPPRRSYNKRKRVVNNTTSQEDTDSDEEDYEQPKSKKKKVSKLNKAENKRMQEWLKNINRTFEEIDHYDLIIE